MHPVFPGCGVIKKGPGGVSCPVYIVFGGSSARAEEAGASAGHLYSGKKKASGGIKVPHGFY